MYLLPDGFVDVGGESYVMMHKEWMVQEMGMARQ